MNPTGLPQVFEESVNTVVQRTYTYGLQRISENQPIQGTWTPSFYGYDGFGSVRQLTSLAGGITDSYNYDAFGNLLSSPGPTPNNYLYRGEQYDPDLGLYYLRASYYNPQTGRFLSRDPLDGNTIDPTTLHKYLYAGGDPVNLVDRNGKDWEGFAIIAETVAVFVAKKVVQQFACRFIAGAIAAIAVKLLWATHPVLAVSAAGAGTGGAGLCGLI